MLAVHEAASMARRQKTVKQPKSVLRLSNLGQSKNAVLNCLPAASAQAYDRPAG
jgi:hypothetical protein